MEHFILLLMLTALFIQGWDYATQYNPEYKPQIELEYRNPFGDYAKDGQVLWFVRFYVGNLLFRFRLMWLAKPLFLCSVCMASVYGSVAFWISQIWFYQFHYPVLVWIVFCFCLAGLNRIILRLF